MRERAGAGAAGGLGFAALAFLGARMRPGIEVVLELVSFAERAAGASLVITGEGSLDAQTLRGKAPAGVARATRAVSPGTPVVAVAGACSLDRAALERAGIAAAYALADLEPAPGVQHGQRRPVAGKARCPARRRLAPGTHVSTTPGLRRWLRHR